MKTNNSVDREWLSRCEDFVQSVLKYKKAKFSHFISPHELAVFGTHYRLPADVSCMTYGGVDDAERVVLGFFPDFDTPDTSDFPITPVMIDNVSGCSHRDVLGSVLGLGIKREMIGDIYFNGDCAVVMCETSAKDYILYNLKTVGRKKVEPKECPHNITCQLKHEFREFDVIVASLRLDAIVSAVAGMGRSESSKHILQDNVNVNFAVENNPDKKLNPGDVVSIRHHGRFVVEDIVGKTKKDRTVLKIKKYI